MKLDELDDTISDNNVLLDTEWRGAHAEERQNHRKPANSALARQKLENYLEDKKLRNELKDIFEG